MYMAFVMDWKAITVTALFLRCTDYSPRY